MGVINPTPETLDMTGFSGFPYAPKYTKSTRKYISALRADGIQPVHDLLVFVGIQMRVVFKRRLNILMAKPFADI